MSRHQFPWSARFRPPPRISIFVKEPVCAGAHLTENLSSWLDFWPDGGAAARWREARQHSIVEERNGDAALKQAPAAVPAVPTENEEMKKEQTAEEKAKKREEDDERSVLVGKRGGIVGRMSSIAGGMYNCNFTLY